LETKFIRRLVEVFPVNFDEAINGLNTMLGRIIDENKEYLSGLLLLSRDGSLLAYRTNGPVLGDRSDAEVALPPVN